MEHKQKIVKVNTYVDKGIADTVKILNNFRKLYTIESCEGRREAFIVFKYDKDNLGSMAKFIFEFLAPKLIAVFGSDVDILIRMNSLGNIQGELLIKKPIIKKFNKYLNKIAHECKH